MRAAAVFACVVMLLCLGTAPGHADARVALLIGNGADRNATALPNPANDAQNFSQSDVAQLRQAQVTQQVSTQVSPQVSQQVPQRIMPQELPSPETWLTALEFQSLFDRMVAQRHYPRVLEARVVGNTLLFKGEFVPYPEGDFSFYSHHGIGPDLFALRDQAYRAQNYRLVHRQSVKVGGTEFIQATWIRY